MTPEQRVEPTRAQLTPAAVLMPERASAISALRFGGFVPSPSRPARGAV